MNETCISKIYNQAGINLASSHEEMARKLAERYTKEELEGFLSIPDDNLFISLVNLAIGLHN